MILAAVEVAHDCAAPLLAGVLESGSTERGTDDDALLLVVCEARKRLAEIREKPAKTTLRRGGLSPQRDGKKQENPDSTPHGSNYSFCVAVEPLIRDRFGEVLVLPNRVNRSMVQVANLDRFRIKPSS